VKYAIRVVLDAGPLGFIVLAANAVVLLAALWLALRAPLSRPRRPLRSLRRTMSAAGAGLAIAVAITAVLFKRASDVLIPPGETPSSFYGVSWPEFRRFAELSWQAEAALSLTAYASIGAAGLVILAAIGTRVASPRKLRARRLFAWAAVVAGAEMAGSIAFGVVRRKDETNASSYCFGDCRREVAAAAAEVLADARLHVALATAIAFFLLTRAARRSASAGQSPVGRSARALSLGLFGIGIVAFAATRSMAFDVAHPLPAPEMNSMCPVKKDDARALPPARAAGKLAGRPVVTLFPGRADFNQTLAESPEELEKAALNMRALWVQVQPRRPIPPLMIAAPASEPLASLAPWLRALARAGFGDAAILVAHPPSFAETATLGLVERAPRCAMVPLKLDRIEPAVAGGGTWGDLAESLSPP
jgi:hypothetical protein